MIEPRGDHLFKAHWDRIHSSPSLRSDLIVNTTKLALLKLREPGYFIYGDRVAVAKELPIKGLDVHAVGKPGMVQLNSGCFLFPKGSPLTKMFNKGTNVHDQIKI
jgi:hypothetical protein